MGMGAPGCLAVNGNNFRVIITQCRNPVGKVLCKQFTGQGIHHIIECIMGENAVFEE
jgi:hypothetical protein